MTQQPVNQEPMSAEALLNNFMAIARDFADNEITVQETKKRFTQAIAPYRRREEELTKNYNDMALIYDKELRARQELEGQVAVMGEALKYAAISGNHAASHLIGKGFFPDDYQDYNAVVRAHGGETADIWTFWKAAHKANKALSVTQATIQSHNAKRFNEGVEAALEQVQKRIDGITEIENGCFKGVLTDKAISTRKAWKVILKALQSIKKEVV